MDSGYSVLVTLLRCGVAAYAIHASYGDFKATVDIQKLSISNGTLPRRATQLVLDWAELHQADLLEDWDLCQAKQMPKGIDPLR